MVREIHRCSKRVLFFWTAGHYVRKKPVMDWLVGHPLNTNQMFFGDDSYNDGTATGTTHKNFGHIPSEQSKWYRSNDRKLKIYELITKDHPGGPINICYSDDKPKNVKCDELCVVVIPIVPFKGYTIESHKLGIILVKNDSEFMTKWKRTLKRFNDQCLPHDWRTRRRLRQRLPCPNHN